MEKESKTIHPGIAGFYANYEYEQGTPLAFIGLFALTDSEKAKLLTKFDQFYADTDQETTDWALEYQVLARMLLHQGWLPVNPRHLDLDECLGELLPLLGLLNHSRMRMALENITEEELMQEYQAYIS